MKTSQDFNENFNQYSSEIEKEMSNLNRMLQEFASNGVVAQQIINDLEPVLAKLHLTIDSFTMNRPDKEKASHRGRLSLTLNSDGKFKFIQFRGYTSRGAGKNENRLVSKAEKICEAVQAALQNPVNEIAFNALGQFISKVQATDGFAAKIAETVDKTMNPYGKKVAFISDKQSWILAVAAVENNITL